MASRQRLTMSGFQSTPPARGATKTVVVDDGMPAISIHAPREGGDHQPPALLQGHVYFNPRPPRGGRPGRHVVWYGLN